jgi:hypothetical protein
MPMATLPRSIAHTSPNRKAGKRYQRHQRKGYHPLGERADHAKTAEVRLYDRLFQVEDPSNEDGDFKDYMNPNSLQVLKTVYV